MKNVKIKLIIAIIFFFICVSVFICRIITSNKRLEEIYNEYPAITKKSNLNSIVKTKYEPSGYTDNSVMVFVTLEDNRKYRIYAYSNYSNKGINDILQKSDKVYKKAGNDTIFIVKQKLDSTEKYIFILRK